MFLDVLEADLVRLPVVVVALVVFVPIAAFTLVFIFTLLLIPLLVVKSSSYLSVF